MPPAEEASVEDPRLHAGFFAAPIPTVVLNPVGLIVAANDAFSALAARTTSASSSILALAHPRDRARLANVLDVVVEHAVDGMVVCFGDDEVSVDAEVFASAVGPDLVCCRSST